MRKAKPYLLSIAITVLGLYCQHYYVSIKGIHWYHILLLIGGQLVIYPTIKFWYNKFK